MNQDKSLTQSGAFRLFYYFVLIAWTLASLGLLGQLRKDLRAFEFAMIFFSMAMTLLGWILPGIQMKYPSMRLDQTLFVFPFLGCGFLLLALVLGLVFGAA